MAVVLFHVGPPEPFRFASGYLAVDLFFLLSGFVIAHAYGAKLVAGRLRFGTFATIRFIRLWPLYALATIASGTVALAVAIKNHGIPADETMEASMVLLRGLLFIPDLLGKDRDLYPLLQVAWSLLFEVVANLLYAWRPAWWTPKRLTLLIGASFVAAIAGAYYYGTWAAGWEAGHVPFAIARTLASFFAGVLIYRFRVTITTRLPRVPIWVLLLLVLALKMPAGWLAIAYGLIFSAVLSPLLTALAIGAAPSRNDNLYRWLGQASYPIYILQIPSVVAATLFTKLAGIPGETSKYILTALLFVVAPLIGTWIDMPVRRWLGKRLLRRPALAQLPLNEEAAP